MAADSIPRRQVPSRDELESSHGRVLVPGPDFFSGNIVASNAVCPYADVVNAGAHCETWFENMRGAWRIHPEDRDREIEYAARYVRAGIDFSQEFRIVLPDETVRLIHAVGHRVFSANGAVIEGAGTHVDVTERKRIEEERERLSKLEAEFAHMNRLIMLGELASSLAHEIEQPIAATITSANACLRWLTRTPPDLKEPAPPQREFRKTEAVLPKSSGDCRRFTRRALLHNVDWSI